MPYKDPDKRRQSKCEESRRRRRRDRAHLGDAIYKAKHRAAQAEFRLKHPDYNRQLYQKNKCQTYNFEATLKRLYGLTVDQFYAREEAQDFQCAICADVPSRGLCVDHDHGSGVVRALLCDPCNGELGMFDDDQGRLLAAAAYLVAHAGRASA